VISDVAAAIRFAQIHAFLKEHVFRGQEIFLAGVAAQGEDVRVLAKKENVIEGAGFAGSD